MGGRTAIIVGGSLGGLFAANMLHRAGWNVRVLERSGAALAGRGAGIVTHPELLDCLSLAGVAVDDTVGVRIPGRVTLHQSGWTLLQSDLPQVLTAWGRLYHLLKAALPDNLYRFDANVRAIEQDPGGVSAVLADGGRERGDLLIGADGIRSTVRALLQPSAKPVYAGYIAWRGMADEKNLTPETHAALFERFAFCLPPGEQMLGYPIAGEDNSVAPGRRRYNYVWYRPADEIAVLPDLLTDQTGTHHPEGIPPGLIRDEVRVAMLKAADDVLAPQFAEVVRKSRQPFFQPIFDLESPRIAFGRVALLGDAAFVARPHCGMGVTKAGADALELVRALEGPHSVEDALRAYESKRVPFGAFIVGHARHLGAYMQAQQKSDAERRMAERYRTPEAIMRETAVPPPPP